MPRLVFLLGLALAAVALAFVATDAALGPRPGVTEANVRRIKAGMTVGQVEALLGGPGDSVGFSPRGGRGHAELLLRVGRGGWALVHLDRDGQAETARWAAHNPATHSLDSLRPLFGR